MLCWRNNIHTWKTVLEEGQASQYKMPEIRIVSTLEKQDIDELHDMVVSFLVDKVFKGKNCHVVKWKGKTYIRLKEDVKPIKPKKKKDWGFSESGVPYIEINGNKHIVTQEMLQEYTSRPRIADEYGRNSSRYYVYGKGKKRG